jgi:hypothetical protein
LVVANGYDAFADAFRQKLTAEVAGLAPDRRLIHASVSAYVDQIKPPP